MPIESTEPPDVISDEFRTPTGITSEDLHHRPIFPNVEIKNPRSRGRPKGTKNHPRKGIIQAQSPGSASAGAGAILKRLRNSKVNGLGRSRSESSPMVPVNGKRLIPSNVPVDDVLTKVLDKMAHDKNIAKQMVFREGIKYDGLSGKKVFKSDSNCLIGGNDGSFIKNPFVPVDIKPDVSSNGVVDKEGMDCSVDPCLVSNTTSKLNMADVEHVGVENSRKANKDGSEVVDKGHGFVFGDMQNGKGILNKPTIGLTKVQFGPSLFYNSNSVWASSKAGVNALKADNALNIDSFAEKLKKGVEDRELQMNFVPQFVSKGSDVLVEVSAEDELPHVLEIEYPQIGMRPARIGKLDVKYQWQPPQCTHCKTFGHKTVLCKVRPKTEAEMADKVVASVETGIDNVGSRSNVAKGDEEGFIAVGKKNKPASQGHNQQGNMQRNNANSRQYSGRNVQMSNRVSGGNTRTYGSRMGPNQQNSYGNQKQQGNVKNKGVNVSTSVLKQGNKGGTKSNDSGHKMVGNLVQKPPLSSKYNENFKPKVLVRGSGSKGDSVSAMVEDLPVSNTFQAFDDHDMVDKENEFINGTDVEYTNVVWPKLKLEVDEVMKSGKYPSMAVKTDWSLAQLDYFFKNCSKYGMEPYIEEEDVESDNEGMAASMKPEFVDNDGPGDSDIGAKQSDVNVWCKDIPGFSMFSVASKLKLLKKPLRKLKYSQGDLAAKVHSVKEQLCRVQADMVNVGNLSLCEPMHSSIWLWPGQIVPGGIGFWAVIAARGMWFYFISHLLCNLSRYSRVLLFLALFPKHVLGMSFELTYMGLSI
ncbi:hypothetical protein CTI12_AA221320 [Artemisia annua]|uniref:DUF4283 domain-containing protein n=1 Tax=Artemisia annua TaxID=35608 RepID=A0A2U1NWT4_ARTAN|nr:hypothetical protein CTI12_AA221320 [Artemisia annua]